MNKKNLSLTNADQTTIGAINLLCSVQRLLASLVDSKLDNKKQIADLIKYSDQLTKLIEKR